MERPGLYKRYTAPSPSHLTLDSLHPLPSVDNPKPQPPHLHPFSQHPSSPRVRVLRKSSQPDLAMSSPASAKSSTSNASGSNTSKKRNLSVVPPPHPSFLSLDKPSITRQHSSPPLTAGLSTFSIDKSRTRKQSFVPSRTSSIPILNRWDLMPSIQGVMSNPTPSPTPILPHFHDHKLGFYFGSKEEKKSSKKVKEKEKDKEKKDPFRLPMMPPPMPRRARPGPSIHTLEISTPMSFQHVSSASNGFGAEMVLTSVPGTTRRENPHSPLCSPMRTLSNSNAHQSIESPIQNHKVTSDPELDGWHIIHPSASTAVRRLSPDCPTQVNPPSRSSSFQQHHRPYPDFSPGITHSTDLNASEVLEHLTGQSLSNGWSDQIVADALADEHQHQQQAKRETGSMRSWRDIKKKREGVRPLSEQALPGKARGVHDLPGHTTTIGMQAQVARHGSSSSEKTVESKDGILGEIPVVPPRRTSKIPVAVHHTFPDATSEVQEAPQDRSLRQDANEKVTSVQLPTLSKMNPTSPAWLIYDPFSPISSPTTVIPVHLRPLPPIPSESNTPPKSLLPIKLGSRLLRPKKASTAPAPTSLNPAEALTHDRLIMSPKIYPKLVARDEPPAALGKRSSDIADRRNGMTAMSFLALEDPAKTISESPTSSSDPRTFRLDARRVPRHSAHLAHTRRASAGAKSIVSLIRSESPVVRHIIPPAELSKIGAENHLQRQDSTSSFDSDWRTDVSRYGGGSSVDLGITSSKTSLVSPKLSKVMTTDEDLIGLPPPLLGGRRRGPVVPPRRKRNPDSLTSPHESGVPIALSPPRTRYAKTSAPPIIQHAVSPDSPDLTAPSRHIDESESVGKEFEMYPLDSGRSAWTLPTNDRPSTMGQWSSPGTPSPTKGHFDASHAEQRLTRGQIDIRPQRSSHLKGKGAISDDEFGVTLITPLRAKRYAEAKITISERRESTEDSEEATTPTSLPSTSSGGSFHRGDALSRLDRSQNEVTMAQSRSPKRKGKSDDMSASIQADAITPGVDETGVVQEDEPYTPSRDRHLHPFLQSSPASASLF